MTERLWNEARRIFAAALDVTPDARTKFVKNECGDDTELRDLVLGLLKASRDPTRLKKPLREAWANYELEREIGRGGIGIVYRARDKRLDRTVALKVLRRASLSEPELAQFEAEARLASQLKHPNIVRVLDLGEHEGEPFFTMDLIEGTDLSRLVGQAGEQPDTGEPRHCRDLMIEEGEAYPRAVARLIAKIAHALHYAHDQNVLHRDVKPSNILWGEDNEPYLVDFGVARQLDRQKLSETRVGTPHYMSPEQARIRDAQVDRRTDVFSLGVVAYELLTLAKPFEGDTDAQVLQAIQNAQPRRIQAFNRDVPPELSLIVRSAMHKDPDDRYETALEMAEDLDRFLAGRAVRAQPLPPHRVAMLMLRRHRSAATAVTVALLVFVATFVSSALVNAAELSAEIHDCAPAVTDLDTLDEDEFDTEIANVEVKLRRLEALSERVGVEDPDYRDVRNRLAERAEAVARSAAARITRSERELAGLPSTVLQLRTELANSLIRAYSILQRVSGTTGAPTLATLLSPSISLASEPTHALVQAFELDADGIPVPGGRPIELGTTPIRGASIPTGYYSIRVSHENGRFGEISTLLTRHSDEVELPPLRLRATDEVASGMVRIPAGSVRQANSRRRAPREQIDLEEFWIDRFEVTNAQYREFLLAHRNHPAPFHWPVDWATTWDDKWNRLPASGMTYWSAAAFAAWAGKRLPTAIEWERAACGVISNDFPYPWGTALPAERGATINAEREEAKQMTLPAAIDMERDRETRRKLEQELYLALAQAVDITGDDRCQTGACNMLGNVNEWTDSASLAIDMSGQFDIEANTRITMGASLLQAPHPLFERHPSPARGVSCDRGFRCAKSAKLTR